MYYKSIIFLFILIYLSFATPSLANDKFETWLDSLDSNEISSFSETIPIKGWIFHKDKEIKEIKLYIDDQWVSNVEYGKERGDVFKAYPNYSQSLNSGFEIEYKLDNIGIGKHSYIIKAFTETEETIEVSKGYFIKDDIYKSWIDYPNSNTINMKDGKLKITGWVFNTEGIEEVYVYLNNEIIGNVDSGLQRNDVLKAYPNYDYSEFSGFNFEYNSKNIKPGNYVIKVKVESTNGSIKEIASMDFVKQKDHTLWYLSTVIVIFYILIFTIKKSKSFTIENFYLIKYLFSNIDLFWFCLSITIKIIAFSYVSDIRISYHNISSSIAVIILIGVMLSFLNKIKLRVFILVVINFIITLIIYSDIMYLRYFDDVTSIAVMRYISQMSELGGSIGELLNIKDIYFFLDFVFIISLFFFKIPLFVVRDKIKKVITVLVVSISFIPLIFTIKSIYIDEGNLFSQTFSNKDVVKELGILNYHIFDSGRYLKSLINKPVITTEDKHLVSEWFNEHLIYDMDSPYFGIAKGKNVILVQEESLQSFVIGLEIDSQEITPNINRLIKEGIYYENFYDQTYNGRTSDGELTALTSLYPLREGTVNFRYPNTKVDTLPKVLKNNGYQTFSAHAFKGSFWNREVMHDNYAFDDSMFYDDFSQTETIGWGLSDQHFFEQSVSRMVTLKQPFLSFLVSLTTHHPYDGIPNKYKNLTLGRLENTLMGDYLHSVNYADFAIGQLIEDLKDKNIYENSIILIYGDHDAGIEPEQISNILDENLSIEKLYDKVPFLIHIPKSNGVTSSEISGHLDITPSVLHLLGLDASKYNFMGYNLFLDYENKIIAFRDGKFITNEKIYDNGCQIFNSTEKLDLRECELILDEIKNWFKISDLLIKTDILN